MSRRTSARHRPFVVLGISLVVVLSFGMLARCGGSGENGEAPESVPANPEEAGEVVVRVSGTEGTAYAGTYGNLEQEGAPPTLEDTLEEERAYGLRGGDRGRRFGRRERFLQKDRAR